MILTENQEEFLIKHQDIYSLRRLGGIFGATPREVYDYYSELIESQRFLKYWKKPIPKWHRKGEKDEAQNNV